MYIILQKFGFITKKSRFKLGIAERKLLAVLCYYIALTVISFTTYAEFTRKSEQYEYNLRQYFICEQMGYNPNDPCDRQSFEVLSPTKIAIFNPFLLGIMPLVFLIFVINIDELKQRCLRCKNKLTVIKTTTVAATSHL